MDIFVYIKQSVIKNVEFFHLIETKILYKESILQKYSINSPINISKINHIRKNQTINCEIYR
jgi:hypothetical protein